jgi:predicted short-subunit dehydrogenase-like oxidoreductase (DUF2520 family)
LIKKNKNVIIIGAGKIAHSIVPALQKSGYNITVIISRKIESAKLLAVKFGTGNYSDKLTEIYTGGGIVLLCVPDNRIKATAKELSNLKLRFSKFIFVHLSGAYDISCLNSLQKKNGQTASLHIMQTFPSKRRVKLTGCYAAVETDSKEAEKILFDLAKDISLKPFRLKSNTKEFYHLAGVFASNFLAGNLFAAETAFNKTGNINTNFFEVITPIVYSTLANIKKTGAVNALSGPIERGDIQTIKKHLAVLKKDAGKTNNNSLLLSYIAQSLNLIEAAEKKLGCKNDAHKKIRELLREYLKD